MFEAPDLGRNVGFLLADISRLLRRDFSQRAQHLGLTPAQWRALAHLARNEGITQAALADILEIQPISLARQLDRMEAAGWIERRPSPTDRRAFALYLRPAASPVLQLLRDAGSDSRDRALAGLNEQQCEMLTDLLIKVKDNLQQSHSDTPACLADAIATLSSDVV